MRTRTVSVMLDSAGVARALSVPAYELRVVKGPDKGKHRKIALRRLVVGSGEGADFRVADPTVSQLHCELSCDATGFKVRDLGAKNGVTLGGRRVFEAWLEEKDDLVLGGSVLRFKVLDDGAEETALGPASFGPLVGSSVAMRELYAQLQRAAPSDAPVLLTGETGTGKELAADALISAGDRKDAPVVVVDCGRLPAGLAESELFGHEAGAYTGAASRRAGAFERAGAGTLFLDEIGELPLDLQPKLLGALERKRFRRVGGTDEVPFEARVVSATHRDLLREVNRGAFRADLYYRLAVVLVRMPSLRERPEDVPALVAHFLSQLPGAPRLQPAQLQRLYDGSYPGNVRELRAAVERAVLGVPGATGPAVAQPIELDVPFRLQKERLVSGFERAYVERLLEACKGNVSDAARRSGLSRVYLHELKRRLGL